MDKLVRVLLKHCEGDSLRHRTGVLIIFSASLFRVQHLLVRIGFCGQTLKFCLDTYGHTVTYYGSGSLQITDLL